MGGGCIAELSIKATHSLFATNIKVANMAEYKMWRLDVVLSLLFRHSVSSFRKINTGKVSKLWAFYALEIIDWWLVDFSPKIYEHNFSFTSSSAVLFFFPQTQLEDFQLQASGWGKVIFQCTYFYMWNILTLYNITLHEILR